MNNFGPVNAPIEHKVELYTDNILIQGTVVASLRRITDLLNQSEVDFLAVHGATITALGQAPSQKVTDSPVMVGRSRIHCVVDASPQPQHPQPRLMQTTGSIGGREAYVRKEVYPCYVVTGTYAIYGQCHLHPGTTLENVFRGVDNFIPITKATIYMIARPNMPWQRDVVIVNRRMLAAMYLTQSALVGAPG